MKNINKFLCILIFFCFIICLNCTYAVSDNAVENDTLSIDYQSDDIYSDSIEVSSDDNHVDEKIENSSNVKIQDNNTKPSKVVKKASSTVKTTITAKDVTKYYQDGTTLKAYLKNSNGKALSGKKITVTYSGKTYSRTTDSKGCVSWDVQKGPGTYSVKFSFSASGYASSSKTAKVTVKAMPTTLAANNLAFTYGNGNNKLKATLKDKNGKVLADKTVVFNFNGKNYNQKTDSKGVATLTISAEPKNYTTKISFTNSNYVTSKKTVTVTVNSIPTSLTVNDLTCQYGENNVLSAYLKSNNNALSNQDIVFNFNGQTYASKTDSNGLACLSFQAEPNTYLTTVSFSKLGYATCSKQVNITIKPIPVDLIVNNLTCEYNKTNYLFAYLKSNNQPLVGQNVTFFVNNNIYKFTSDSNGRVAYGVDLVPGDYVVNVMFSNNHYEKVNKTVNLKICSKLTKFEYSLIIPNYVNLTNAWRLVPGYLKPEYIAQGGAGGKVKMPVTRDYIVLTESNSYEFNTNNIKSKNLDYSITELSNLHITSNSDYANFTYSGFVYEDINQISAVYRQKEYYGMSYPDYEELLLVVNGVTKLSIGFTNPVGWDETGVRFAFINNDLGHHQDVMTCRYDKFNNYQYLRFAETGESVVYSDNMLKISNFPTKEKIHTHFKINGTSIMKDEWISFGKHYNPENSFEVIQTYAITDKQITNNDLDYYIGLNSSFPVGFMKASYGTFLTALNTIKMYDEFMENASSICNVSAVRENSVVSMCGVEYGGTAYVHCPDPTMKYNLTGNITNINICRYFTSFLLSEFECMALRMAGINCTSSIYTIFSEIINLKNYTLNYNDNNLVISLPDDSNKIFKFNLENFTVFDLSYLDKFLCKGAISVNPQNYCFHDTLTDKILYNHNHKSNSYTIPEEYSSLILNITSNLALAGSASGYLTAISLIGVGVTAPLLLALPLTVGTVLFLTAIYLKSNENHGNVGAAFGDSITGLLLNMA